MKTSVTHPDRAPDFVTGAYSDGVIAGGFLYVSGQACVDFKTSTYQLGTIEDETRKTLDNVKAIVEAAGARMEDVVKSTVHLSDIADFKAFNAVYGTYFSGVRPARTTVESGLGHGIKVEIDVVVQMPAQ